MAEKNVISEELTQEWARLSTHWKGDDASAFYRKYILRMQDTARQFETASTSLNETTQALAQELALIERSLNR